MQETWVWSLGREDPLEKGIATHSSIACGIAWAEEPGGLQSLGLQRGGQDWQTKHSRAQFFKTYVACLISIWTLSSKIATWTQNRHDYVCYMWPEYFFFQMKFWLLFPFLWLPIACKITLETQANTEDPSWLPFICFQLYSKLHLLPILLSFLPAFLKFSIGNYPSSHCCCCCSATKSCLTLCDPMDCSTPGYPVQHHLLEFAQTHVHCVGFAIQPSHPP